MTESIDKDIAHAELQISIEYNNALLLGFAEIELRSIGFYLPGIPLDDEDIIIAFIEDKIKEININSEETIVFARRRTKDSDYRITSIVLINPNLK